MAFVLPHSPTCLVGGVPFTGLSGRVAGLGCNPANSELCNRCNSYFVAGGIQLASALTLKLPDELTLESAPHSASVLAACSPPRCPGSGVVGELLRRVTAMTMPLLGAR